MENTVEKTNDQNYLLEKSRGFLNKLKAYYDSFGTEEPVVFFAKNLENVLSGNNDLREDDFINYLKDQKEFLVKLGADAHEENNTENLTDVNTLVLELNTLLKDFNSTGITEITSLVPFEEIKEEPKEEIKKEIELEEPKKGQLAFSWANTFNSLKESSFTKTHTSDFDETLKIKFKVTETDDFEEPYLEIKGKLFAADLYLVRNYLKVFERGVEKSLKLKDQEEIQEKRENEAKAAF